jgi:hypothetical protein
VAALPSPFLATSLRLINPDWGLIAGIAGLIAVFAVPGIVKLISAVLSE